MHSVNKIVIEDYIDSNSEKEQYINKLRDILGNYQNYQINGLSIERQTVPQIQVYVLLICISAISKLNALHLS